MEAGEIPLGFVPVRRSLHSVCLSSDRRRVAGDLQDAPLRRNDRGACNNKSPQEARAAAPGKSRSSLFPRGKIKIQDIRVCADLSAQALFYFLDSLNII